VAERPEREPEAREPTTDRSSGISLRMGGILGLMRESGRLATAVVAVAAVAGVLMVASEFSTVAAVHVISGGESCKTQVIDPAQRDRCELSGFERHGGAVLVLGLLTLAMGWGAGVGASRPAAVALVAIGVLVIGITLILDLPKTHQTGAISTNFEDAAGVAGTGFYFELIGGALALVAGGARLALEDTTERPRSQPG
jgi:hypothetical protein